MEEHDIIINKIIRLTKSKYPDSEVYLYGSHARGNSDKYSDWDLLILLNRKNIPFSMETKMMDDFYELELETGEIISPLIYSKSDWMKKYSVTPFYENIQKESIRIK